ncbi:MAG: hypothetical protein Q4C22_00655 [Bacillota bacterium]|nr:hypothetical protein [Bacillota bacterium]
MNLTASYKYQLMDHKNAIIIFYAVFAVLFLLSLTFLATSTSLVVTDGEESLETYWEGGGQSQVSGIEAAGVIFLFVMGLCTFKEPFKMLAQNGVSRKTLMAGKLLTMVSVAAFMAVADKLIGLGLALLSRMSGQHIIYRTLYESVYPGRAGEVSAAGFQAESFLYAFVLYLAAMAAGYFLTLLFYRLPKGGKIAVGVGVPVFVMVYPLMDLLLTGGQVSMALMQLIYRLFGAALPAIASFFGCFLLLMLVCWLLMRRAVVRA